MIGSESVSHYLAASCYHSYLFAVLLPTAIGTSQRNSKKDIRSIKANFGGSVALLSEDALRYMMNVVNCERLIPTASNADEMFVSLLTHG